MKIQFTRSILSLAVIAVALPVAAGDPQGLGAAVGVTQSLSIGHAESPAYRRASERLNEGIGSAIEVRIRTRNDGRAYHMSRVAGAAGKADAALTGEVANRIETAPELRGLDIRPEATTDGAVKLYGSVKTKDQKAHAERLVASTEGVTRVESHLTVQER